jgi:hypothetical protein
VGIVGIVEDEAGVVEGAAEEVQEDPRKMILIAGFL